MAVQDVMQILADFALLNTLSDMIAKGARIITVSPAGVMQGWIVVFERELRTARTSDAVGQ